MQLSELIDAVEDIVQDSAFTEIIIKNYLNEAQTEIAGGVQSSLGNWLTPPLPGLFIIGTVNTSISLAYIVMPNNFQRNLQFVVSPDGNEIDIAESFISFSETYLLLDKTGSVAECCEFGGNFYYQGIPSSSNEITIHYYKFPTDMSDDTDEPDGIPKHLHRGLLINRVCEKIYELVEDGIDGPGVNTEKYGRLFAQASRILELFIPNNYRNVELY